MDKLGKTHETMGIQLGISCVDSLVLPVDIPIYQGFWGFEPVCKKYLKTIFSQLAIGRLGPVLELCVNEELILPQ